jgi:putative DNA primase/helicase
LGLQVFPCKPRAKVPATRHGFKNATSDKDQVRKWWKDNPKFNIGIVGGSGSGVIILDIDTGEKKNGFNTLRALEEEHGTLPESWTVRTGGGGIQVYFKHPGFPVPKSEGKIGRGIDMRGDGAYGIGPPSVHDKTGNMYRWEKPPLQYPLAEAPSWIIELNARELAPPPQETGAKEKIPHGERHKHLVSEAGKLRRIGYGPEQIAKNLQYIFERDCNPDPPPEPGSIARIAHSTLIWAPAGKEYGLTDKGNADRFADTFKRKARYCVLWKKWLIWNGIRWKKDEDLAYQELAKDSVEQIREEALKIKGDPDKRKVHFAWYHKSQSSERLGALVKQARSLLAIKPTELDTDPWLLNVKNGTIDLRTGKLEKHNQEHFITKLAPFTYRPDTPCPLFLKFLGDVLQHNAELIEFVQKFFGYALTGDTRERIFMIFQGKGLNGKSTLIELIQEMMGDYSISITAETLLSKERGAIRNDIAKLQGARFVSARESEESKRLNTPLVKEMTGGDTMTARFLHAEEFDFKPSFKLILGTNYLPRLSADDKAAWDRIRRVHFKVHMKNQDNPDGLIPEDKSLPGKLRAELNGILSWCVAGCLAWQREGLNAPDCVMAATSEYREDEDIIATFIDQCCTEGEGEEAASTFYRSYKHWCLDNGYRPLGSQNLKKRMEGKGFERTRSKDGIKWAKISLLPEAIIRNTENF